MKPFLNFHVHRKAVSPTETVIRNLMLPAENSGQETTVRTDLFCAGIHPWHIPEQPEAALAELERLIHLPACVAVGETGLDKQAQTTMKKQQSVFVRQMQMATSHNLPVVIHCVRAWDELLAACKSVRPETPCIIHGFRGKPELAKALIRKGFYLSFGFRFNAQSLSVCPPDRLLLETDEDQRHVEELYQTAATWLSCTPEELNNQCWKNLQAITRLHR